MTTPKKKDLTPKSVLKWVQELKKLCGKGNGDNATKYQIRYMFVYIEDLISRQIPMKPIEVEDEGHRFTCPRCKTTFETEYHVDDFKFCNECGQKFREVE